MAGSGLSDAEFAVQAMQTRQSRREKVTNILNEIVKYGGPEAGRKLREASEEFRRAVEEATKTNVTRNRSDPDESSIDTVDTNQPVFCGLWVCQACNGGRDICCPDWLVDPSGQIHFDKHEACLRCDDSLSLSFLCNRRRLKAPANSTCKDFCRRRFQCDGMRGVCKRGLESTCYSGNDRAPGCC